MKKSKEFNKKCMEILKQNNLKQFGILRCFEFPGNGKDFSAINDAREAAKKFFAIGSMCFDMPIALADKDHYSYVAKWNNIKSSDHQYMTGVLISDDFRNSSVMVVIFKKSTCPLCGEDIEPAGIRNIYSAFYEQMVFSHKGRQNCPYIKANKK